jgi:dienelactone hydrolase
MGALRTACRSAILVLALCSATVPVRGQSALGARGIPGVVIVDPDAAKSWALSRAMAGQLQRAGYATLTVTHDPLAAAAALERRASVRSDDVAIVGYGSGASTVLATIVERYDLAVSRPPVFRSAVAFAPTCARRYGDWVGRSLAAQGSPGSTGAPHGGEVVPPGLYRTPTPLLIVGGQTACQDLARDSYEHEYFVRYITDDALAGVQSFIAQNAQYANVSFPSSQPGTTLTGELTLPAGGASAPTIIISPGTAGIEGFPFWERPWAQRLRDLGYASLIVDSYLSRRSSWKNHWQIDASTVRARDLLDARAYLAAQPFVLSPSIGLLGRSSGGTAIFAAIVQDAHAPSTPPPFGLDSRPPFALAVVDYGYCQLAYGDWPGGTPTPSAAIGYRTTVPVLLQVGANDTTVPPRVCDALAQSARQAGSSVDLVVYPNAGHRFDAGVVETPPATVRASVDRITSFLTTRLHSAPRATALDRIPSK